VCGPRRAAALDAEHNFVTQSDPQDVTHSLRDRHLALGGDPCRRVQEARSLEDDPLPTFRQRSLGCRWVLESRRAADDA
jgi:hypothetical protein